jgi:hypothetical protein
MSRVFRAEDVMREYRVSRNSAYRLLRRYGFRIGASLRVREDTLRAAIEGEGEAWRDSTESAASTTPGDGSPTARGGRARRGRARPAPRDASPTSTNETHSIKLTQPRTKPRPSGGR